jgi:hypothetical protein
MVGLQCLIYGFSQGFASYSRLKHLIRLSFSFGTHIRSHAQNLSDKNQQMRGAILGIYPII